MDINLIKPQFKIGLVFLFLYQVVRLICLTGSITMIVDSLVIKRKEVPSFDMAAPPDCLEVILMSPPPPNPDYLETITTTTTTTSTTTTTTEANPTVNTFKITDLLVLLVPILDIVLLLYGILTITYSFTVTVGLYRWTIWILRCRLTWMRMLWTLTAILYAALYLYFRKKRYKETLDEKYIDSKILVVQVTILPIEYVCLGVFETVCRIYTCDRLNSKAKKFMYMTPKSWGRFAYAIYIITLIIFALRNFTVSFYFGLYSAILADEDQEQWLKNVLVVMQIYLAIMRGKFFQFFLRLFLGNFMLEDDSETYTIVSRSNANGKHKEEDAITPRVEDEKEPDKYAEWFEGEEIEVLNRTDKKTEY